MYFEWRNIEDLTGEFLELWRELGCASSSPNIYLMPEFMLPALRHLENDKPSKFAIVWNDSRTAILALGVFNEHSPGWQYPYRHLSAVKSKHSFQTGILLRSGFEGEALDFLLAQLLGGPWRGIFFRELREDTTLHRQLQESACRRGIKWFVDKRYLRASVSFSDGERWRNHVSSSRHKNLRRARSRLGDIGDVQTRFLFGDDISDATVEHFLRLESFGWKAESALRSTREERAFFKEMTDACRSQGLIWFVELLVGSEIIASTVNFCIGDVGFAFKTGMDPTYARYAPGYLVEYGFLEAFEEHQFSLREMESGSQAGSFIEELWPGRVPMVSGHFAIGALPYVYSKMIQVLKTSHRSLAAAFFSANGNPAQIPRSPLSVAQLGHVPATPLYTTTPRRQKSEMSGFANDQPIAGVESISAGSG